MKNNSKSFIQNYLPVLGLIAFILVVVLIEQYLRGYNLAIAMSNFMGGFLMMFSSLKLTDIQGFAHAFSEYDIIASKNIGYAKVYPFIELILGLAFIFRFNVVIASAITFFIMGIGSIGVIKNLNKEEGIKCACVGTAFDLPLSKVAVFEDVLMTVMSATLFFMLI